MKRWGFIFVALVFISCSHEQCNNVPQRPLNTGDSQGQDSGGLASGLNRSVQSDQLPALPADAVLIVQPTGELQCGQGQGTLLDDVLAKLRKKKIKIYEAHTQSDGMAHMDLCGSPTGKIHVVAIPQKDLKKAEKLGFKPKSRD